MVGCNDILAHPGFSDKSCSLITFQINMLIFSCPHEEDSAHMYLHMNTHPEPVYHKDRLTSVQLGYDVFAHDKMKQPLFYLQIPALQEEY